MVKEVEGCPAKTAISAIRDLAIFCGDTRDVSLKQEREVGILTERKRNFLFL